MYSGLQDGCCSTMCILFAVLVWRFAVTTTYSIGQMDFPGTFQVYIHLHPAALATAMRNIGIRLKETDSVKHSQLLGALYTWQTKLTKLSESSNLALRLPSSQPPLQKKRV